MTTPDKPASKGKSPKRPKRAKRSEPARSGAIRTGAHLPKHETAPPSAYGAGMSPHRHAHAHADADLDEGMINQAVADAVRNANEVLSDTIAQGRVAAEQFRHGNYNMRDVPVDVQIMGMRMIRLARELSDTTLNIIEQLLRQMTQLPQPPPPGQPGKVPPFPTGAPPSNTAPPTSNAAPPSTHSGPPPAAQAPDNTLALTVRFTGKAKAAALPSPLWKPSRPTLPSELEVTPMRHMMDKADPIADVRFEADIEGNLTAIVPIPAKQPPGVYAGMVVPSYTDVPLGVLTIEVLA